MAILLSGDLGSVSFLQASNASQRCKLSRILLRNARTLHYFSTTVIVGFVLVWLMNTNLLPEMRIAVVPLPTLMVKKLVPVSALSNNALRQRPSMINEAREVLCQGRFPASLIYVLIVNPSPAVPSTFYAASLS
jgi:hypothetical protein